MKVQGGFSLPMIKMQNEKNEKDELKKYIKI